MNNSNKLTAIQVMRGIAVVLVLFFHATENLVAKGVGGTVLSTGQSGVDIFFIISGFIIFYSAKNKVGKSGMISFLASRVKRIVPNYWFYTFFFAALLIVFPDKFDRSIFDINHLAHSLFFVPMTDNAPPLISLGWTLNYEVYFYSVFLISILMSVKYRLAFVSFVIFLIFIFANNSNLNQFYKNDVVFEFILGAMLYIYYTKYYREFTYIPETVFYIAIALIIYLMSRISIESRFLSFGIPSFIVMVLSLHVRFSGLIGELLERIGEASYSIYLSHALSMPFVIKLLLFFGSGFYLSMTISIIFCLMVGWCSYQVLERRLFDFSWWKFKVVI
ncbi:acyltransferase family protein [Serratia liquefaciens]|uniref:acyltransferase family protein n=1 Tax=Serratia liquefaciens TaxID=614 RepID=UPI00040F73E4|nr:acyltransferase [Serratia liquefaciens]CAI0912460.1 Uncharacterized protein conserved in bacteria [Serratia liquefaciens]CAI2119824.1 Uncharacterized protein conserved in bacteria [Serratia liquefaciens]CAI2473086.1 Uncharacterized protein conserved in bacteria [Serratia liquefaciens]HEJ7995216.1 acyltransferase [Serratia liquefaciens]